MAVLNVREQVLATSGSEQIRRLSAIAEWDLTRVSRRAQRKLGWSNEYRDRVEEEYRRFLGLIALSPSTSYGMAGDVDHVWHEHILDTQDYFRMCKEVFSSLVHHCPNDDGDPPDQGGSSYRDSTLPALRETYAMPADSIWPDDATAASVGRCCGHISHTKFLGI